MGGGRSDWRKELGRFLEPFLDRLGHKARRQMCPAYVAGLIGSGDRKSIQPTAARDGQVGYDQLHHFIASGVWDAAPLENVLLAEADKMVGSDDAWLIIDDTALPKKGERSVGVAPQYASALWQDSQLSVSGLGDAGLARSAGDGRAAPISTRDLDERSRAHEASPRAEGSADRSNKAGDRDRRNRSCHRLRRAFRLCACPFRIRIKWAFPPGFERARAAVGSGTVATPERLPRGRCPYLPHRKNWKAPQIPHS